MKKYIVAICLLLVCSVSAITASASDDIVAKIFLNNNISEDNRVTLLTHYYATKKETIDFENFLPILDDKKASAGLKCTLLGMLSSQGEEYADVIEAQALKIDDPIVYEALPDLYGVRPEKAEMMADSILSDLTEPFSDKYKAALMTKPIAFSSGKTDDDINAFIDVCDNMLNNMQADDEEEKAITIIYTLSSTGKREALSYLMNSTHETVAEFGSRCSVVEENKAIIEDLLKEEPSQGSVDLLAKCEPYYVPTEEALQKVNDYMETNAAYFESETEQNNLLRAVADSLAQEIA